MRGAARGRADADRADPVRPGRRAGGDGAFRTEAHDMLRPTARSPRSAPRSTAAFEALLPIPQDARARLYEAMRYAAIGGGKRMRPLLVVAACGLFKVDRERALRVALAVECIHVYSLIHDDLPCMDDDDLRRGKPTLHRAFDECDRDPRRRFAARSGLRDPRRRGDARGSVRARRTGRWSWPAPPARRAWRAGR